MDTRDCHGPRFLFCLETPVRDDAKLTSTTPSVGQNSPNSPQVSVGKVILYTVVTWLIVAALSKGYVTAMRETGRGFVHMLDAHTIIWPCAIFLMGIYSAARLNRGLELLWGICFTAVCYFLPGSGGLTGADGIGYFASILVGIGYFSWCYVKLERDKLTLKSLVESNPVSTQPPVTQAPPPTKEEPHLQATQPVEQLSIEDSVDSTPSSDIDLHDSENDDIYEKVWNELESDSIDRGLWSRLYAKFGGNTEKLNAAYIAVRADQLIKEREGEESQLIKKREEEKSRKEKEYQQELEGWVYKMGRNEGFKWNDLNRLKDELLMNVGDSELWTYAVLEGRKKDRNPEEIYRIARYKVVNRHRRGLARLPEPKKGFRES